VKVPGVAAADLDTLASVLGAMRQRMVGRVRMVEARRWFLLVGHTRPRTDADPAPERLERVAPEVVEAVATGRWPERKRWVMPVISDGDYDMGPGQRAVPIEGGYWEFDIATRWLNRPDAEWQQMHTPVSERTRDTYQGLLARARAEAAQAAGDGAEPFEVTMRQRWVGGWEVLDG